MMMNHKALAVFLFQLCCLWLISETRQVKYDPNWKSLDARPLPSWYDQAKVGIFIHWGVFSVPSFGSEWFWNSWRSGKPEFIEFMKKNYRPDWTYADFARDFTAEFFDPIEWTKIFERSGAKYVVLTSKHHEGFTLWPSKYSFNWNAKDVGPGRDLVGELATAIRQNSSLHFGLYHSLYEWFNPLYIKDKTNGFTTKHFVESKIMPEMLELVNTYQPEIFWSDGDWEAFDTYWNSKEFLAWLYNESPVKDQVVVNDRWGIGTMGKHGGFLTSQDRFNPGVLQNRKWEDCMTLDRQSWGFRREASLQDYFTTKELIATLVETISCGGNILINVGPTKYGKILPIFEERLEELGFWLEINGEAIYKSQPWIKQNDSISSNVWYTQSDPTNIYAISLEYPPNGIVTLGSVPFDSIRKIRLLGTDKVVEVSKNPNDSGTLVKFPDFPPNYGIHHAYTFKINLKKRIHW